LRLFVAINLSEEVRRNIAALTAELSAAVPGARWIRAEAMHITLKFIGHVPPERVEQIQNSLTAVRSPAPVEMRLQGAGVFPSAQRPRVFWVGIESSPNLAEIAAEIEGRLEPLGIAREERAFHPHLTLARFKDSALKEKRRSARLQTILDGLGSRGFGAISADEFHLYQSELKRGGAEHTPLAAFRFVPSENAYV
jgi:2'-5' RNA ligase